MEETQNNKSEEESIIPILNNENIKNNRGIIKIPLTYRNVCMQMAMSTMILHFNAYPYSMDLDASIAIFFCIIVVTLYIIVIICFCCCYKCGLNFIFDYDNLKLEIIHHSYCERDFGDEKISISFNRIQNIIGNVITSEYCNGKSEKYSIKIELIDKTIINVVEWDIGKDCCSNEEDAFDITGYVEKLNHWLKKGQDQVVE